MKKPDEATKILALTECLLLWDYIAEHGCTKIEAIRALHKDGKLAKRDYNYLCPFCDRLRVSDNCSQCLWPGAGYMRCCDAGSPFLLFCFFHVERKAAGRAMLRFLEALHV